MKKIVLTVALALTCISASANLVTSSLTNNDSLTQHANIINDSVFNTIESHNNITLAVMAFYDIDRLSIHNGQKEYIRIEDGDRNVVLETHDSVDIYLPSGNYYVYTSAQCLKGSYKNH